MGTALSAENCSRRQTSAPPQTATGTGMQLKSSRRSARVVMSQRTAASNTMDSASESERGGNEARGGSGRGTLSCACCWSGMPSCAYVCVCVCVFVCVCVCVPTFPAASCSSFSASSAIEIFCSCASMSQSPAVFVFVSR